MINIIQISKEHIFITFKMEHQVDQYSHEQPKHQGNIDYSDDQQNLTPQGKTYQNHYEQTPSTELENTIMEKINAQEKQQDLISKQLQIKLQRLVQKVLFSQQTQQEKLKMRMHQLALSKILVNTHGKSEFYLVKAHHHLGQAYLNYKCYEQALDHLTMSLKKNAKINDMNEIKLYHSYVLTTYSRCYFEISSYDDALEILKKAHDIQLGCESGQTKIDNFQTLRLIASCYLKLKNWKDSLEFIEKSLNLIQIKKGKQSKQYAKTKIQKAKILIQSTQQQRKKQAIKVLQSAIQTLEDIKYQNQLQIADYYELLANFYSKVNNHQKQIENMYKKCQIYSQKYEQGHQKTLKIKKSIALLLQKHNLIHDAIKQLQQVLENEEKYYPQNRTQIGKTLKSLGMCYLNVENKLAEAESYLKRAQKYLSQSGIPKSIKQIKTKLQQIRELRESKSSQKDQLKLIQRQINQQPIGMAH